MAYIYRHCVKTHTYDEIHICIASSLDDASYIFSIAFARDILNETVEYMCSAENVKELNRFYIALGVGYFVYKRDLDTNYQEYIPVNIRQRYIDLALEYIET